MNLTHITNYKVFNKKVKKEIRFSIISDLHFSYKLKDKKLNSILEQLKKQNPDYILFPGDFIDSVNMVEDINERKRFLNWLNLLGKIAPTLISLGSHDYTKKTLNNYVYKIKQNLLDEMNNIKNVYVLNNCSFIDESIAVFGYTQSKKYYDPPVNFKETFFRRIKEDKKTMLKELKDLRIEILKTVDKNKLNILLVHSPVCLTDNEILNELSCFDYFISGHMHNGCVPPLLYELWNSDKGIIAPNKSFFPHNERNTLKNKDDKSIVNGPLTMFHPTTGPLQLANILFPMYMTNLSVTNDKNYDTPKVYTKKKYTKNK